MQTACDTRLRAMVESSSLEAASLAESLYRSAAKLERNQRHEDAAAVRAQGDAALIKTIADRDDAAFERAMRLSDALRLDGEQREAGRMLGVFAASWNQDDRDGIRIARNSQALAYSEAGDFETARSIFEDLIGAMRRERHASLGDIQVNLITALIRAGKDDEARAVAEQMVLEGDADPRESMRNAVDRARRLLGRPQRHQRLEVSGFDWDEVDPGITLFLPARAVEEFISLARSLVTGTTFELLDAADSGSLTRWDIRSSHDDDAGFYFDDANRLVISLTPRVMERALELLVAGESEIMVCHDLRLVKT
jgi:hypothetical protein